MGEVYRATDSRLKRDVALKILPESLAADPERLARFQREAEVLASLNHPHIAAIYGLEESDGVKALVMELVEGDDLSQRIARGPIPFDEALPIAKQIAEALEAAHEQGVIHRDLKPANIKIRPDGTVKVLDFGLAKLAEPSATTATNPHALTMSPTITSPAIGGTMVGTLLGTTAYMSPEQARGRQANKRADIWAFGCVLYEMLAGKRAFDGEDIAVVLASVIKGEPDWAALPSDVPTPIVMLLRSCLEKEPRRRAADVAVAMFVLDRATQLVERVIEQVEAPVPAPGPATVPRPPLWRRAVPVVAGLSIGALFAGAGVWLLSRPAAPSAVRTMITTSGATVLRASTTDRDIAITPDGSRVIYRGNDQLLVRTLNQLEPNVLGGLGTARGVFVSPDGQWIGFFDENTALKKVRITGGPPVTVCVGQGTPRGATWGPDGTIIFATSASDTGLQRVSAAGGEPTVLTKPDYEHGEADHLWPEFVPGGAVLFTISPPYGGAIENAQIAVLDPRTGTSKVLIRGGSHAQYVPTGHLVYGITGTLRAVPFDLDRLEVVGTPSPVLEGVETKATGAANVAVASNGSLVYVASAPAAGGQQTIVSLNREGRASSALPGIPPDSYRNVRVSPDGSRLALATERDVWTYDFGRATLSRLTTDPAEDRSPLWTPDGERIIFTSRRAGYPELFWRPADGTGSDERLLGRARDHRDLFASGWSADGKQLLFTEVPSSNPPPCAIGQIAIEHPADAKVLVKNGGCNLRAAVSPDGRWLAYASRVSGRDQIGRDEIYVERYPELGNRQQISTGGGSLPLWSRDGQELFFGSLDGRQMFTVPVKSGATLIVGRPQLLFEFAMQNQETGWTSAYDLTPDGRFIAISRGPEETGGGAAPSLVLVQHWFEELKRLVPVN